MPSRQWLKGQEIAEEERQVQLQNEAADRAFKRRRIALTIARENYGSDDVEIDPMDDIDHAIGVDGDTVEYVDGGYWVPARVWVDAEDVEERMDA